MTSKEALYDIEFNSSVKGLDFHREIKIIKKDLEILQAIRNTYKVFKDDDEYFLSDGKHLYMIDRKQFDKWNGWLNDK